MIKKNINAFFLVSAIITIFLHTKAADSILNLYLFKELKWWISIFDRELLLILKRDQDRCVHEHPKKMIPKRISYHDCQPWAFWWRKMITVTLQNQKKHCTKYVFFKLLTWYRRLTFLTAWMNVFLNFSERFSTVFKKERCLNAQKRSKRS